MITFTCPGCQATFKLPDELAGKPARCSKCDQRFTVPAAVHARAAVVKTGIMCGRSEGRRLVVRRA